MPKLNIFIERDRQDHKQTNCNFLYIKPTKIKMITKSLFNKILYI